jgi:hypothetical protein
MEQLSAYNLGDSQMEHRVGSSALTVLRTATVVEECAYLIWTFKHIFVYNPSECGHLNSPLYEQKILFDITCYCVNLRNFFSVNLTCFGPLMKYLQEFYRNINVY